MQFGVLLHHSGIVGSVWFHLGGGVGGNVGTKDQYIHKADPSPSSPAAPRLSFAPAVYPAAAWRPSSSPWCAGGLRRAFPREAVTRHRATGGSPAGRAAFSDW